jgi:hypothetical protein
MAREADLRGRRGVLDWILYPVHTLAIPQQV